VNVRAIHVYIANCENVLFVCIWCSWFGFHRGVVEDFNHKPNTWCIYIVQETVNGGPSNHCGTLFAHKDPSTF